jgi:hypothetical protein
MPRALKKFLFLALAAAVLLALILGRHALAAALAVLLFGWLALETRVRTRFRFLDRARGERGLECPAEVGDLRCDFSAVFIQGRGRLSVLPMDGGAAWSRNFDPAPLAVLGLPGGRLIRAAEDRLHLCDARGRDQRSLDFDPPLLRQGYRLVADADGICAALATPWFVQVFDTDLASLRGRIPYEEAGHYFKYAALAPGGAGLLTAGAFLLEQEDGGSTEARWDWWEPRGDGSWERRWKQSRESYENSHLRGVQVHGSTLCVELWHSGYSFLLQRTNGSALWERRGGEKPVLSPGGAMLAWEEGPGRLVMGRAADGTELWEWRPKELIRLKRPLDDGSCLVVEGRCLRRFDAQGRQAPERWLKNDAEHLAAGWNGGLAMAAGRRAAVLRPGGGY